jgi:hypothetical protein
MTMGALTQMSPPTAMTGASNGLAAATPMVVKVDVFNAPTELVEHQTAVCNVDHRPVLHQTAMHSELE